MQTVLLNNGVEMPILGFGVFQVPPAECAKAVLNAFEAGYRMIDTAQAYYNEEGVGKALEASGLPRKDVFLVTKVWISNAGEEKAAKSIERSLEKLRTDYIDLLLIHQPFGDYPGTWRAMEKALADGKVRAIGLSNFYPDRSECATVKPAVNQLQTNVFRQQWDAQAEMKPYGTRIMAWGAARAGESRAHAKSRDPEPLRQVRQDPAAGGASLPDRARNHCDPEDDARRAHEGEPRGLRLCPDGKRNRKLASA